MGAMEWKRLAENAGVKLELVMNAVREVAEKMPEALEKAIERTDVRDKTLNPKDRERRIGCIREESGKRCKRILEQIGTRAERQQAAAREAAARKSARRMPPLPRSRKGPGIGE